MINFDRFLKLTNQYSNSLYKLSERKTSDISDLEQYVDQNYAVHFSDLPKLGINPQTKFATPVAVCGYPLTKEIYNKIINNSIPYAQDKKYMHLYKVNGAFNVDNYDELKLKEDLEKILELVKQNKEWQKKINYNESDSDEENINKLIAFSRIYNRKTPTTFATMWALTERLSNSVSKWNALLQYLGYKALVDDSHGVLWGGDTNGPGPQVQVYDRSVIEYIKYYTPPARYKEEQKSTYKKLEENLTQKLTSNQDLKNIKLLNKFLSHSNPQLRESAERAAVTSITDQGILFQIAINSQNSDIRSEIVDKITDQEKLKELFNSLNNELKLRVIEAFTDPNQLEEIAINDPSPLIRLTAVTRIEDENILIRIYNKTKDETIQEEIIYKTTNKNILQDAIKNKSQRIKLFAIKTLGQDYYDRFGNSQEILEQAALEDSDASVKAVAAQYIINPEILKKLYLDNSINDSLALNIVLNFNFKDLDILKQIAIDSNNSELRVVAIDKINSINDSLALNIVLNFNFKDLDILKQIAIDSNKSKLRVAAIDKINDNNILKEIFLAYEQEEYFSRRSKEQDRILQNADFGEDFYKWIALNSKNDSLREVALSKMALSKKARSNKIAQLSKTVNLFYKTIQAISK